MFLAGMKADADLTLSVFAATSGDTQTGFTESSTLSNATAFANGTSTGNMTSTTSSPTTTSTSSDLTTTSMPAQTSTEAPNAAVRRTLGGGAAAWSLDAGPLLTAASLVMAATVGAAVL